METFLFKNFLVLTLLTERKLCYNAKFTFSKERSMYSEQNFVLGGFMIFMEEFLFRFTNCGNYIHFYHLVQVSRSPTSIPNIF